jgi:hypothetical protein
VIGGWVGFRDGLGPVEKRKIFIVISFELDLE